MNEKSLSTTIDADHVGQFIYMVRGHKVMLDEDLATLYAITTKILNQAVKRNIKRFPEDFAFKLNREEWKNLRSQIVTSSYGGRRYTPYAFTEHGVAMLSGILRSPMAIEVNIEIMRAFIRLRHVLASHKELSKEVIALKDFALKHSQKSDQEFRKVWKAIDKLATPIQPKEQPRIGFDLN
jgi:hypothetical protein